MLILIAILLSLQVRALYCSTFTLYACMACVHYEQLSQHHRTISQTLQSSSQHGHVDFERWSWQAVLVDWAVTTRRSFTLI
eukprot:COSAG02_NODE_269_length_26468_cov_4.489021_1_plen_81_part_00